ncbi:MAG: hypothetical protein M3N17_04560 [Actinomycetota bacterium]|nr:hypothetical protein [Actinomycetota bacterium]
MFDDVPLLLAFTGGLVASVNPCGFAMLPAYLSFFLGLDNAMAPAGRATAVARALRVGSSCRPGSPWSSVPPDCCCRPARGH